MASSGVWLTLDAGQFAEIEVNARSGAIRLGLSPATEFLRAASLRIKQLAKPGGAVSYHLAKQLKKELGAYSVPLGTETTWVEWLGGREAALICELARF